MSRGGIFASAAVDDSLPALIIEKACNLSVTNNVISALSEISSYLSHCDDNDTPIDTREFSLFKRNTIK